MPVSGASPWAAGLWGLLPAGSQVCVHSRPTAKAVCFRVSCNASFVCPAPLLDAAGTAPLADCAGHGTCLPGTPQAAAASCACDAGWGDEGCGTAIAPLSSGVQAAATVATGFWTFYGFQVQSLSFKAVSTNGRWQRM